MKLAHPPEEIRISEVVRKTEPDLDLLECFNPSTDQCAITRICNLKSILFEARANFVAVLEKYTLADAAKNIGKSPAEFKFTPIAEA